MKHFGFIDKISVLGEQRFSLHFFIQLMAVTWIKEFVALAGHEMLPYASGILSAVLPCLAYEDDARKSMHKMKLL